MIRFPLLSIFSIILCLHSEIKPGSYRSEFLHAADIQKQNADYMIHETVQSHKHVIVEHNSEPKKKRILRFLSMGRKKNFSPSHMSTKRSLISSEPSSSHNVLKISDTYIGALSFYNACYKGASPTTAMYIRMQSSDILKQLSSLHAPSHIFTPTTFFEPGYKEVLLQSKELTEEPIMHTLIINDVMKEHLAIEKIITLTPSIEQCAVLCSQLHICMKTLMYMYTAHRIEEYQKINIHAYVQQTWQLLNKIPECSYKKHTMQKLFTEWKAICKEKLNIFSLLDELERQAKKNRTLYTNPLVVNNKIFCTELIKDQCNILHNLLYVHQANAHNPLKQYWITKAANTSIKLVTQTGISHKPHPEFITVYHRWQKQHLDVLTLLRLIHNMSMQLSKLTSEQTAHRCFEILSVLIDIHHQHIIPPNLLMRLINPLHSVISTLNSTGMKHKLSSKELRAIKTAEEIIHATQNDYLINYLMQKTENASQADNETAKKMYFTAVKYIMKTPETSLIYNSILPDRIYHNLLNMYEKNVFFSHEELTQLKLFADRIKMPLPINIEIREISANFRSFLHTISIQNLIEPTPYQESSSSGI